MRSSHRSHRVVVSNPPLRGPCSRGNRPSLRLEIPRNRWPRIARHKTHRNAIKQSRSAKPLRRQELNVGEHVGMDRNDRKSIASSCVRDCLSLPLPRLRKSAQPVRAYLFHKPGSHYVLNDSESGVRSILSQRGVRLLQQFEMMTGPQRRTNRRFKPLEESEPEVAAPEFCSLSVPSKGNEPVRDGRLDIPVSLRPESPSVQALARTNKIVRNDIQSALLPRRNIQSGIQVHTLVLRFTGECICPLLDRRTCLMHTG